MTMDATPRPGAAYRLARRMLDMLVRRNVALVLVLLALVLGVATFVVLSGGRSLAHHPQIQALVFVLNFLVLLLLATSLTEKVGRVL
ncbi:MAG: two-component sensor histidine kinase, partial [Komagataeibacter saccharivorans]